MSNIEWQAVSSKYNKTFILGKIESL